MSTEVGNRIWLPRGSRGRGLAPHASDRQLLHVPARERPCTRRGTGIEVRKQGFAPSVCTVVLILGSILSPVISAADPMLPLPRVPLCGDEDGSPATRDHCDEFVQVPDLQIAAVGLPLEIASDMLFDFAAHDSVARDEFGFFPVDEPTGAIDGLLPGDPGYLQRALERAVPVFPAGSTPFASDVILPVPAPSHAFSPLGQFSEIALFLVRSGTLAELLATNPENALTGAPVAFFSIDALNPDARDHLVAFQTTPSTGRREFEFAFEDTPGAGEADYDDDVYYLEPAFFPGSRCATDRDCGAGRCYSASCNRETRLCVEGAPHCGNGIVEPLCEEECDTSRGCAAGRTCNSTCRCEGTATCEADYDVDGRVAVVTMPSLPDADSDGRPTLNIKEVARQFYCAHADAFEFLTIFTTFPEEGEDIHDEQSSLALYQPIQNNIRGLGPAACCYNVADDYGSTRLEGVVNMHSIGHLQRDRRATADAAETERSTLDRSVLSVLGQEFGHRWCCYVQFQKPQDGGPRADLLDGSYAHWSDFLDSDASVMEGRDWKQIGSLRHGVGDFKVVGKWKRYSPLDLYLMGLLAPDDVPPFFYITDVKLTLPLQKVQGTPVDVAVQDVIRASGPREPAAGGASTRFRQAFLVVADEAHRAHPRDVKWVEKTLARWVQWFKKRTRGRGTIDTSLPRRDSGNSD
jgi:hypothetical protein